MHICRHVHACVYVRAYGYASVLCMIIQMKHVRVHVRVHVRTDAHNRTDNVNLHSMRLTHDTDTERMRELVKMAQRMIDAS